MPITPEIAALIERLNQELDETEREARESINIVRQFMSRFPNNDLLIQFFAYFNAAQFFVENSRRRIQIVEDQLETVNVPAERIQESGEDLATLLGQILEAKMRSRNIINRLENMQ